MVLFRSARMLLETCANERCGTTRCGSIHLQWFEELNRWIVETEYVKFINILWRLGWAKWLNPPKLNCEYTSGMVSRLRSLMDGIVEGVGSEAQETSALDCPTSCDEDLNVSSKASTRSEVVLKERLWSLLPDVILDMILMQLPPAAKCRFRCVCRKWKSILSSSQWWMQTRSPCTIMTGLVDQNAKFFCHSEEKWFSLPFSVQSSGNMAWEVVDADAGLICYRYRTRRRFRFAISNPLTHLARIISPTRNPHKFDKVKLFVDREKNTFKVLVLNRKILMTEVYDSTAACWHIWTSHPQNNFGRPRPFYNFDHFFLKLFVWRNVVYAYPMKQDRRFRCAAFNMESGQWTQVQVKLPLETGWWTDHFVASDEDQVMFAQILSESGSGSEEGHVVFWKLLDKGSCNVPEFSLSMWEKAKINLDRATKKLLGSCTSNVYGGCYQKEYFCFILSGTVIDVSGTVRLEENCVKYSFGTKTWDVMPHLACKKILPTLYSWEPSLNIGIELNVPGG